MNKLKVGDRVVVEAQVRRVDHQTFTIQIHNLSPIMLPHGHPSVLLSRLTECCATGSDRKAAKQGARGRGAAVTARQCQFFDPRRTSRVPTRHREWVGTRSKERWGDNGPGNTSVPRRVE